MKTVGDFFDINHISRTEAERIRAFSLNNGVQFQTVAAKDLTRDMLLSDLILVIHHDHAELAHRVLEGWFLVGQNPDKAVGLREARKRACGPIATYSSIGIFRNIWFFEEADAVEFEMERRQ